MSTPSFLLSTTSLTKHFGGLKAVENVALNIPQHGLFGLIGPNGAGKTTFFNLITGVYLPTNGEIKFNSESIKGLKPHVICERGIARTFQNIRLFSNLSVLENVLIGSGLKANCSMPDTILQNRTFNETESQIREKAMVMLKFMGLENKWDWSATSLPYGEQRKLEIARALAADPKLLCLDEPAAGMNHHETEKLMGLIIEVKKQFNLTVLLIEHDMKLVMGICERIMVLDHGMKIAEGTPSEIRSNQKVVEAYLGVDEH